MIIYTDIYLIKSVEIPIFFQLAQLMLLVEKPIAMMVMAKLFHCLNEMTMAYREHPQPFLDAPAKVEPMHSEFDLNSSLAQIAHWLPKQAPLKDFIHHNTLHAFQAYPFHEAIAIAAKIFGASSYLPLRDYQTRYQQGRISQSALEWAIKQSGCLTEQREKLNRDLFKTDNNSHYPPPSWANNGIRTRWLTCLEIDLNSLVHPILFRLLSNFLDQGISRWSLPKNGESFWYCVARLAQNSFLPLYPLNESNVKDLLRQPIDIAISTCLQLLVHDESLYAQYLLEMLLAHPGWSGMVRVIEENPRTLLSARDISLKEMIAVELLLELAFVLKKRGQHFRSVAQTVETQHIALLKTDLLKPTVPLALRVWHEAMEWTLHQELLIGIKANSEQVRTEKPVAQAQALFCLDDRECSLRRYLEEVNPNIETFGAAGFFGIDFLYQGMEDAYPVAQCPNIIQPKHLIKESAEHSHSAHKTKKTKFTQIHFTPHSMFRGWLYTQTLGLGYAVKMAWNVFKPVTKLPNIKLLSEVESHTQLHLLRESDEPNEEGYLLGFSVAEMADRIGGLLKNIGLTQNFAPLVVIVAHGSSSVNNPHFAAYDCGACAGKPGAPNARAFAWMANHPQVRAILWERGIEIPKTTHFVPALHNTSRDEIRYFDQQPHDAHSAALHTFQQDMHKALQRNARERCRWFELAPKSLTNEQAHQHVIERASSIFEPRPEYNHSNNLYCIVGRRQLTRGLFLDRRAFLHSYNPNTDPHGDIMGRILTAVIPVCGGINLEYLFSRLDNSVYGAGTKLPHNVIGLIGVANGVEGDLRTGLPSQMIEVHEPARLLIVVEQNCDIMDKTLSKIGALKEWLDNEWVRLIANPPEKTDFYLYTAQGWQAVELAADIKVPTATRSEEIIVGKTQTIPVHQLIRKQA